MHAAVCRAMTRTLREQLLPLVEARPPAPAVAEEVDAKAHARDGADDGAARALDRAATAHELPNKHLNRGAFPRQHSSQQLDAADGPMTTRRALAAARRKLPSLLRSAAADLGAPSKPSFASAATKKL